MKQWIACIFLLIFTTQVLPVKEIGRILVKGQLTEEIHDHDHPDEDNAGLKLKKEGDPFLHAGTAAPELRVRIFSRKVAIAIHETEHLPKHHVPDILTPPPNCA